MNIFVPIVADDGARAIPIDFQWTGPGLGMQDVAMHLYHSVEVAAVAGDGELELVHEFSFYAGERALIDFYYERLLDAIGEFHGGAAARE